ncbi:MAG: DUF5702 domain-containing protein [Anaerovoracaceae bacterium]|jgi:hypothetical protein
MRISWTKNFKKGNDALSGKRGSISVFLALIIVSVITALGIIVEGGARKASHSYCDGLVSMACNSVMSEFAIELNRDYGLLGCSLDRSDVEERMEWYINCNLKANRGYMDPLQLELDRLTVDFSNNFLSNPDVLEEQINEYMRLRVSESLIRNGIDFLEGSSGVIKRSGKGEGKTISPGDIRLENTRIIEELPSRIHGVGNRLLPEIDSIPELSSLLFRSKSNLYTNLYILKKFRHTYDEGGLWKDTFFKGEIEYILSGRLSDDSNRKSVKLSLITLRSGINLTHIYSNSTKRQAVIDMATMLTPGPEAVVTQAALATAWAAAEGANDMARLERGGRVPLYKTEEDWMIDLESAVKNIMWTGSLEPESDKGMEYGDYLLLLLFFQDRNTKLIRTMDLIQLNMKGRYDGDFLITRCFTGFDASVFMGRKKSFAGFLSGRRGMIETSCNYFPGGGGDDGKKEK